MKTNSLVHSGQSIERTENSIMQSRKLTATTRIIFYMIRNKLSSYDVLRKGLKTCVIKITTPPPLVFFKRLAEESNINTICLLYDIK